MRKFIFIFLALPVLLSCESDNQSAERLALDGDFFSVRRYYTTSIGWTTLFAVCHSGLNESVLGYEAEQMCYNAHHFDSLPYEPEFVEPDPDHPVFGRLYRQCTEEFNYSEATFFSCD
ncbi:MAG: hypothetical protein ACTSXQ_06405 [Alphaproteobacteria bacterium]